MTDKQVTELAKLALTEFETVGRGATSPDAKGWYFRGVQETIKLLRKELDKKSEVK